MSMKKIAISLLMLVLAFSSLVQPGLAEQPVGRVQASTDDTSLPFRDHFRAWL